MQRWAAGVISHATRTRLLPKVRHMRPNPFTDALSFLTAGAWTTLVFWLLLIGSVTAAVLAWRADPTQRSVRHVGTWVLRIIVGTMWWQQSLWKIPPHYDWGLIHWMEEMVAHASTQLQSVLVRDLVLPHIAIFGPLVYAIEVAIAASLILGLLTRLSSVLGALMAINLWLGLYDAPGEWVWTYMFLVVIEVIYLLDPPGRSLGFDVLLWRRAGAARSRVLSSVA
jgi:uncharacterized membrane protein YphA (DoxX/SURF4 family)